MVLYVFTQPAKKVEYKVTKEVKIKTVKPHELVKPKVSQAKNKILDIKPNKSISEQENPENESNNNSVEAKPIWHISDKKMGENEKEVIEKHRKNKQDDGKVYENDDIVGINDEVTSSKPSTSLSDNSLLDMEEAHISKQVH